MYKSLCIANICEIYDILFILKILSYSLSGILCWYLELLDNQSRKEESTQWQRNPIRWGKGEHWSKGPKKHPFLYPDILSVYLYICIYYLYQKEGGVLESTQWQRNPIRWEKGEHWAKGSLHYLQLYYLCYIFTNTMEGTTVFNWATQWSHVLVYLERQTFFDETFGDEACDRSILGYQLFSYFLKTWRFLHFFSLN